MRDEAKQCETRGCHTPADDVKDVRLRMDHRATLYEQKITRLCKRCRQNRHGSYLLVK
jgi:hypothetical protein